LRQSWRIRGVKKRRGHEAQGQANQGGTMKRLNPILVGIAGEYFVAAELSRRGYVASITLRNTRGIDLLAANADATRSVGIQVKTRQDAGTEWVLSKKAEDAPDADLADNLFYVFVSLNRGEAPSYHIVPRIVVAEHTRNGHARWLATPGKRGQAHGDSAVRKFTDAEGKYRDAWNLLELDRPAPRR
jgi:hypothetical protein